MFYNSLPLQAPCGLPVNLHGRFVVTPDRRSLRLDSKGGEWNNFLAVSCFPPLYSFFLESLFSVVTDADDYYSYWPVASLLENEISRSLQSAFWTQLIQCPRKLFGNTAHRVPLSHAIFDDRKLSQHPAQRDPVLLLVKYCLPSHVVVVSSGVIEALRSLQTANPNQQPKEALNFLDAAYLRSLIQWPEGECFMRNRFLFSDKGLRTVLEFAKADSPIEILEGCWILRLGNGHFDNVQIIQDKAKVYYLVDKEGFELFKRRRSRPSNSPDIPEPKYHRGLDVSS